MNIDTYSAERSLNIPGRGLVIVMTIPDHQPFPKIGTYVHYPTKYGGQMFQINFIEMASGSRILGVGLKKISDNDLPKELDYYIFT